MFTDEERQRLEGLRASVGEAEGWARALTAAPPEALRLLKWTPNDIAQWVSLASAHVTQGRTHVPTTFIEATGALLARAQHRHRQLGRLLRGVFRAAGALVQLHRRAAERAYAPDGLGYHESRAEFDRHANASTSSSAGPRVVGYAQLGDAPEAKLEAAQAHDDPAAQLMRRLAAAQASVQAAEAELSATRDAAGGDVAEANAERVVVAARRRIDELEAEVVREGGRIDEELKVVEESLRHIGLVTRGDPSLEREVASAVQLLKDKQSALEDRRRQVE